MSVDERAQTIRELLKHRHAPVRSWAVAFTIVATVWWVQGGWAVVLPAAFVGLAAYARSQRREDSDRFEAMSDESLTAAHRQMLAELEQKREQARARRRRWVLASAAAALVLTASNPETADHRAAIENAAGRYSLETAAGRWAAWIGLPETFQKASAYATRLLRVKRINLFVCSLGTIGVYGEEKERGVVSVGLLGKVFVLRDLVGPPDEAIASAAWGSAHPRSHS